MTLIERSFTERILLVGVVLSHQTLQEVEAGLRELALLVDTAGALVVGQSFQRRDRPDPATFIGSGKAEEIHDLAEQLDVDTVVFDEELSPAQQRNLEKIFGRTAIDRTAVILDIFAQNAKSIEGMVQVELALLTYRLPRLRGKGGTLSQQVGRIGTRGPGETKLEEDRRRLQQRISALKKELAGLERTRQLQRRGRERSRIATVTIVGYTNSGKSTLLNALTQASVFVADRLFATLDPRTRRVELPGGEALLLTDTVGFVRKLPHQLIEAFKSTLEIVAESDLLIHLVDASSPDMAEQMSAVREVLREIDAHWVEELLVFNKVDLLEDPEALTREFPASLLVSASKGRGLDQVVLALARAVRRRAVVVEVELPSSRGDAVAWLHREGEVLSLETNDAYGEVVRVLARLELSSLGAFESTFPEIPLKRRLEPEMRVRRG